VVKSPFVRIGAVVTCASCQHRYLLDQTHLKRVPNRAAAGKGAGAAEKAEPSGASSEAGQPQPGGMSGLSEMMRAEAQRERDNQFNDYDTIAPPIDRPGPAVLPTAMPLPTPATSAPSEPAPEAETGPSRQQKAIRSGYLLAGAAALVLAALGIGLWSMDWSANLSAPAPLVPEVVPDPGPVYEGPIFQGLPLLQSTVLEHSPWEQPNRPYVSSPPQDEDVYIEGQGLLPGEAGAIEYVGRVVCDKPGIVLEGGLTVSLVNPQGTERARTRVPIVLVSPDQGMALHLPIPANLDPTTLNPAWSITVRRWQESAVFIEDLAIETESRGADTMARIVVGNDTGEEVQVVTLLITAMGEDGRVLRRWRVSWDLPLGVADYVEFFTRTAVNPSWDIRSWSVSAAAG
jgi:hypothetical protein